jgi:hypothetical protein
MSKIEMIEREISELPREEFCKLADWVGRKRSELEDEEDRRDVEEASAALKESGAQVPWTDIKRKHGLI